MNFPEPSMTIPELNGISVVTSCRREQPAPMGTRAWMEHPDAYPLKSCAPGRLENRVRCPWCGFLFVRLDVRASA